MSTFPTNAQHALILQGGGALGAYQAGAFETMARNDYRPDYVAGISIGAINSAIIAGNEPSKRVERLRAFWDTVTSTDPLSAIFMDALAPLLSRSQMNEAWAGRSMLTGAKGFFEPRVPAPFFRPAGSNEARSFYDTSPLRSTLLELVDFDLINSKKTHLSVGAVNVETGNLLYFDNHEREITPDHIMASGALPPGFPPVEIDGQFYWDGGLVSNTPLDDFLDKHQREKDAIIFQFDLFDARGHVPKSVLEIEAREKSIRFSSRTRYTSTHAERTIRLNQAIQELHKLLPDDLKEHSATKYLLKEVHLGSVALVHMIYRQADYENASMDYEFSHQSMEEHWNQGAADANRTLSGPAWQSAKNSEQPLLVIDAGRPEKKPVKKETLA